jgi:hypothetical protein
MKSTYIQEILTDSGFIRYTLIKDGRALETATTPEQLDPEGNLVIISLA